MNEMPEISPPRHAAKKAITMTALYKHSATGSENAAKTIKIIMVSISCSVNDCNNTNYMTNIS